MKRLFEFLLPERTHLKAVIAALIAIFLLSGLLAFQVHKAEQDRAVLEAEHVQAFQEMALRSITGAFNTRIFNALAGAFSAAVQVSETGGSDAEMLDSIHIANLCGNCVAVRDANRIFLIDYGHSYPDSLDENIINRIPDEPTLSLIRDSWETGIFSTNAGNAVYAFLRDVRPGHNRAWVIPLPPAYVRYILNEVSNDTSLIASNFRHNLPIDSLFRVTVTAPGIGVAFENSTQPYASARLARMKASDVYSGLEWQVGMLPRGRDVMVPPASPWISPVMLFVVMGMIASVIGMAIILVRREEELHRLRSDLISGVSHELRTPLAQIRMFAETLLLGRTRTEAERRRSLEVIDQEAKRLSHFVENMLQFAKGEAGRTRLAPEPTSFAIEVRRAVESFAPMCQGRGVEVRAELENGVTAPVDRAALRRIMLNLMENALKYGPDEQRITVGVAIFGDVVRLWVDDEGEGIPRMERERVFESFYRLNRAIDTRVTGSGIGLAVVRQLATLHGGRAWADEAPGGGARLVVEFPDAYIRTEDEGTGWAVA